MKVSLIIPTYNEAETIETVIERALYPLEGYSISRESGFDPEVIVVDDSSPDGTAAVASSVEDERVNVVVREGESGLSSAVLEGFEQAREESDVLAVCDGDLQHPPEVVRNLAKVIEVDSFTRVAVGTRRKPPGGVKGMGPARALISEGATALGKVCVRNARLTTDPMSGMFALRRELYEEISDVLNPRGYKILLEILAKSELADHEVADVPYVFKQRAAGESSMGLEVMGEYCLQLSELLRYRLSAARERPEDSVFKTEHDQE